MSSSLSSASEHLFTLFLRESMKLSRVRYCKADAFFDDA